MISIFSKFTKIVFKAYFNVCILISAGIIISIIFTHLFHSSLSSSEYLKSIFIIWVGFLPSLVIIYLLISKIKSKKTLVIKLSSLKNNKIFHIISYLVITICTILLISLINSNYFIAYLVPVTCSGKPNLFEGDYLLVDRFWIKNNMPSLGDVIGFKTSKVNFDLVKRCIAMGGDTVEVRDGIVTINNKPEGKLIFIKNVFDTIEQKELEYYRVIKDNGFEHLVCYKKDSGFRKEHFGPIVVPEGHYFLLGDNRDNSGDSRYYGSFPKNEMFCKAGFVFFSIDPITKKIRWARIGVTI